MRREQPFTIPPAVRNRFETRDETTRSWVGGLPTLARDIFAEWDLRADGHTHSGEAGIVVPVRRADGAAAALKFQPPSTETAAAVLALTRWDGQGAVRLLDSSSERGVLLLERLTADRSLHSVPDDEAIHVVGGLLARLHAVAAPDELPRLDTVVAEMMSHVEPARRVLSPDDRVRLDRWVSRVNEVRNDSSHHLLHWDVHYGNVLAAEREPWLAIDPEPLVGDAGFDLWPALDSGLSDDATAAHVVRRRFDILTEMLILDRHRAAAWTMARLLQNLLWDIDDGNPTVSPSMIAVDTALARY